MDYPLNRRDNIIPCLTENGVLIRDMHNVVVAHTMIFIHLINLGSHIVLPGRESMVVEM